MKHFSGVLFRPFTGVLFRPCETTELLVFTSTLCAVVVWSLRSGRKKPLQQVVNEGKRIITVIYFN